MRSGVWELPWRQAADTTVIKILTWNIFHGRDEPPDKALYTRRAEWTRRTERNETHVQVNRDLWREYTDMLCGAGWDVALLQECPPRWEPGFSRECRAESHRSTPRATGSSD